jgi:hypothetical protein
LSRDVDESEVVVPVLPEMHVSAIRASGAAHSMVELRDTGVSGQNSTVSRESEVVVPEMHVSAIRASGAAHSMVELRDTDVSGQHSTVSRVTEERVRDVDSFFARGIAIGSGQQRRSNDYDCSRISVGTRYDNSHN